MELTSSGVTVPLLVLCLLQASRGKLVFRNPLHDARIYENAPPGVLVTTIHAYEPQAARKSVMYSLLDVRDHLYFSIDPTSGNISTAKSIDRKVGDTFEIIAVAISQGETKLRQLQVTVTEYNQYPPVLEHDVYRSELHVKTKVGVTVLRIKASDNDPLPYNAEIYYRLDPEDTKGRFALDPLTGILVLSRALDALPHNPVLEMGVVAEDGGSPKRWDTAKIEILVKTISEPRDVRHTNATGKKVQICWSKPRYGHVLGYLIKYREVEDPHGSPSFHNITSNSTAPCTTLVDLKPWTDYEFRVYGWNSLETGQGSSVGRFGTRPDYCQMNICRQGECHILNEEPGYHCDCKPGYYGEVCDKFNPCSVEPCENFGVCRNISDNKYRCECLSGFSGQNCSEFNPCALRPSPCLNGGRCESTASHKYQCYCTKGFYGKTCQFFDPCSVEPCRNGGRCENVSEADYICKCAPGYAGKQCEIDVDECVSSPCKHGGICIDAVNNFHCKCAPGYRGKRCHLIEHCMAHTIQTNKGVFRWNSTVHGRAYLIECPFGSVFPDREGATGYAKRRCYLLSNGSVAWGRMDLSNCREEGFKNAEDLTGELKMLTEDPKHLNIARLQEAAKQIENVFSYAIQDKKIAHNMLSIISNMMDVDEAVLVEGDRNGTTATRLTDIVERFVSEVKLEKGEVLGLETENLVVKAVSWDPDLTDIDDGGGDGGLLFGVRYKKARKRIGQGKRSKHRSTSHINTFSGQLTETEDIIDDDAEMIVPYEALLVAQNQTYQDVRVKFVAYRNDKFFRSKPVKNMEDCWRRRPNPVVECVPQGDLMRFSGRRVLQVSVANVSIANLSDPVVYVLPSPTDVNVFCAFWNERERFWSTDGLITNQSLNTTTCLSSHMTAFSLLLDPTPNKGISQGHHFALSMISYIGCGLSMIGLLLTFVTYSLFRCLNRDHPGQILLHLCSSMLLMNAAFVAGSQKGHELYGVDVCVAVAVLVHYFLLTTLSWMGVEAANMYQLLVHVFASSESHFMLKRSILAWGIPLIIVGVTVLIDWGVYENQNEYCMLSASNPYVYYISYLGPSCLILLVNLTVFIMVTRVLFTPRNVSKPASVMQKKEKVAVTAAQVRGAFSVMVLLGVSWVFGAFAVGEARLVFQYLFCVANSLQGFLIFIVRCVQYPEARSAWCQLLKTGTLKKYRGMIPPGSWSGNSNSSHNKQNGHSTTTRLGSADANAVAFNANFWNKTSKEEGRLYDEQQGENGMDFANRSSQLLTFSRSSKRDSSADEFEDQRPSERNASRVAPTNADSFSDTKSAVGSEADPVRGKTALPCGDGLGVPSEPKSRSSYGSSIGYIDEESELRDKTGGGETRFNKPAVSGATKSNVCSGDIDKQNSWPRTLSSFVSGGKEVQKSPLADMRYPGTLPKRILSPSVKSPLVESPERHSFQVIPLQLRASTPVSHMSHAVPPSSASLDSARNEDAAEGKQRSVTESSCQKVGSFIASQLSPEGKNYVSTSKPSGRSTSQQTCVPPHVIEHENSCQSPQNNTCPDIVPLSKAMPCSTPDNQTSNEEYFGDCDILREVDTFSIWERQGLVSPSKAMFMDSAASRL